jgi:hypothetical protein
MIHGEHSVIFPCMIGRSWSGDVRHKKGLTAYIYMTILV